MERADTNRANMANAAFKGSGLTNVFGGLGDAASVGVYASGGAGGAGGAVGGRASGTGTTTPYVSAYDDMNMGGGLDGSGGYSPRGTYGTDGNHPNRGFRLRSLFAPIRQ